MSSQQTQPKKKTILKHGLRWIIYLSLALLLLHESTSSGHIEECREADASIDAMSWGDYRNIVEHASPDPASSRKVILVVLGDHEPSAIKEDFCEQRLFIARLIQRLKALNVVVIALDKFYDDKHCEPDDSETHALINAINSNGAVVTSAIRTDLIPPGSQKKSGICLEETPPGLDLNIPSGRSGTTRIDADTRRIPLKWPVLDQNGTTEKELESFALVTARVVNPDVVNEAAVQMAMKKRQQPYSTIIDIPHYSALSVLCGSKSNPLDADWKHCQSTEPLEEMHGASVIIGDHFGSKDIHPAISAAPSTKRTKEYNDLPEGFVYGADLQANYVAALLDRRVYFPLLSEKQNELFIIAFFIVLQILFWRIKRLWIAAAIGFSLWLLIAGISFGLFAFRHYLLTVWVHGITLGAILVSWLEHWAAKME